MEIWAGVFPRCSKMLYCGPNEGDFDGDARDGGGRADGGRICVDTGGPAILSHVQRVATAHWVFVPLTFMMLMDGSTCDMQLIRLP